jgi:hypothetical protein
MHARSLTHGPGHGPLASPSRRRSCPTPRAAPGCDGRPGLRPRRAGARAPLRPWGRRGGPPRLRCRRRRWPGPWRWRQWRRTRGGRGAGSRAARRRRRRDRRAGRGRLRVAGAVAVGMLRDGQKGNGDEGDEASEWDQITINACKYTHADMPGVWPSDSLGVLPDSSPHRRWGR